MFLVNHDSEQFNNTQGRMSIIELNGGFIGEIFPVKLAFIFLAVSLVSTDDILKRGRYQEILLLKSQLLALFSGVVGVKDTCDVLGLLSCFEGLVIVAAVEGREVKLVDWD